MAFHCLQYVIECACLSTYHHISSLQEVIQNADDARATEVKFFLDCRSLQTLPPTLVNDDVACQQFTGPALLSYNNTPFKKEDWESIQSLQQSGKAKNPHKVGKFGIGFNSVYHITGMSTTSTRNDNSIHDLGVTL